MTRFSALIVIFFLTICHLPAQVSNYPRGYFRWPLALKPEIVANLGELRPNHWHMGLDIRTAQKVDQMVYAAADGYVAYIGIRPLSFGRFIIINHPNGLSTLYAHLNEFAPAIEKYATEQQYKQESWAVELELTPDQLPVKKGTFISYSGTTGGSQGPHVHFEIRDTKTNKCLNPLLFGMPLADNVKPVVKRLAVYDRERSIYSGSPAFYSLRLANGIYQVPKVPVIKTGARRVSLAIQSTDQISGSRNEDGIYTARVSVDDEPKISFVIDSIGYDQTGFMNAHIDYKYRYNGGSFLQHLSRMPGDRGGVYHPAGADGILDLGDGEPHAVKIAVGDSYGNTAFVEVMLQYDPALPTAPALSQQTVFTPNFVNVLEKPDFECYLPEGAIYDTVYTFYNRSESSSTGALSASHQVNDVSVPVHDDLRVRIKPTQSVPAGWRNKIVIERSYRNGRQIKKADWQDGWMSAAFGDFGSFRAYVDLAPPSINSIGSADTVNLSAASRIAFTPTDNFGVRKFRAELNGQWLRFTNDKARTWIYKFDERCPFGVHHLKVQVEDVAGNITEKEWWFKRSAYTPPAKKKVVKKGGKKKVVKKKK